MRKLCLAIDWQDPGHDPRAQIRHAGLSARRNMSLDIGLWHLPRPIVSIVWNFLASLGAVVMIAVATAFRGGSLD